MGYDGRHAGGVQESTGISWWPPGLIIVVVMEVEASVSVSSIDSSEASPGARGLFSNTSRIRKGQPLSIFPLLRGATSRRCTNQVLLHTFGLWEGHQKFGHTGTAEKQLCSCIYYMITVSTQSIC